MLTSSPSSSSSSILEPPSYAEAIFRPSNPPTTTNPNSDYLQISVSHPQKEPDSHITYLITTRISGIPSPSIVRRRFRHVVALADRLAQSHRGLFVPIRPDKGVVESQMMHRDEFLERRRGDLEKYLVRLANHPVLGCSEEIRVFLRGEGELDLLKMDELEKGGRDLVRMFKEMKQMVASEWGGVRALVEEEDKEFLERKGWVTEFGLRINVVSEQVLGFSIVLILGVLDL